MLISETINRAFNEQVGHELSNSNQYLAIAAYFENESLYGLAKIYSKQADEEREHAMKFIKFLHDAGGKVAIPGIPEPRNSFESPMDAAQHAHRLHLPVRHARVQPLVKLVEQRHRLPVAAQQLPGGGARAHAGQAVVLVSAHDRSSQTVYKIMIAVDFCHPHSASEPFMGVQDTVLMQLRDQILRHHQVRQWQ